MSAIEKMIRSVLVAMNFDPDLVKTEVTSRIEQFEKNFATLNNTLISHDTHMQQFDADMEALFKHLGLERVKIEPPSANTGETNAGLIGTRNAAE